MRLSHKRQQVHYLSSQSQNEECSEKITKIKLEVSDAKYYSYVRNEMIGTRYCRPVAAHSDLILKAIEAVGKLTLTPEGTIDLASMQGYFSSFVSVLMSSIWIKVLSAIDERNKILQTRAGTVDVEVQNLRDFLCDLQSIFAISGLKSGTNLYLLLKDFKCQ